MTRIHQWTAHPHRTIIGLSASYSNPVESSLDEKRHHGIRIISQAKEDGFIEWQLQLSSMVTLVSMECVFIFSFPAVHFCPFLWLPEKKWMVMPNATDPSIIDIWRWHQPPTMVYRIQPSFTKENGKGYFD